MARPLALPSTMLPSRQGQCNAHNALFIPPGFHRFLPLKGRPSPDVSFRPDDVGRGIPRTVTFLSTLLHENIAHMARECRIRKKEVFFISHQVMLRPIDSIIAHTKRQEVVRVWIGSHSGSESENWRRAS